MSTVLRRKIEIAAGLPPSLARRENFWRSVLVNVNTWSEKTFGPEAFFAMDARRVCDGERALKVLSKFEVAAFDPVVSPAINAVAVDHGTLNSLVAHRLGVDAESLEQAPITLKRLVLIKAAKNLAESLWPVFPSEAGQECPDPEVGNGQVSDFVSPGEHYLFVNVASGEAASGLLVSVVLSLSYLMGNLSRVGEAGFAAADIGAARRNNLENIAFGARLDVSAVLGQVELSIAELYHLDPGDSIMLPRAVDRIVGLEVKTASGALRIGTGTMGTATDRRAIRIASVAKREDVQKGLSADLASETTNFEKAAS